MRRLLLSLCLCSFAASAEGPGGADSHPQVRLHTSLGDILLELDRDRAPSTVANFLTYVREGFYDGTVFHRVIPKFMIQGGGMTPDMRGKPTHPSIGNEANNGLKNATGTIAMARMADPHSASSQFFINVADNAFLDHQAPTRQGWGYTVFGKVTKGMDVVMNISQVPTTSRAGHQDVPVQDVIVEQAEIVR